MNPVTTASLAIMLAGAAISIGIFRRLGPITTPRGMRILGGCVAIAGFLLGLTQSEPVPRKPATTSAPADQPAPAATAASAPPSANAAAPVNGR